MKKVYVIFGLSLLIFFTGCDKFKFPQPPYPQVQTLPVSAVSASGATLSGKITYMGEDQIVKYGFVWGEFIGSIYGLENTVNITGLQGPGQFSVVINSGMISGKRYIVKAFVTNSLYTVYGEPVTFLSQGSR